MKFRTETDIRPLAPEARIGYDSRILALGSCFADEMAARLQHLKFRCTANPAGVLFNPASVAAALRAFAAATTVHPEALRHDQDRWFHYGFHGSFSASDPETALAGMNAALQAGTEALHTATHVLLTFGTAWVYEHAGHIVANCHRQPAAQFNRRRLQIEEIAAEYDALIAGPLAGKQVILTVSPVRHLGDGLEGNAVSKAVLRLSADELAARHPSVHYFPAYEILLDDLRDYRFYGSDLVHPSPQAVDYVWELFVPAALDDRARSLLPAVERILAAAAHRPQNPQSEAYRTFCRRQVEAIGRLPEIDFRSERACFEKYIG